MAVEEKQEQIAKHWCGLCDRWWGHSNCCVSLRSTLGISQPCNECEPRFRLGFFFEEDELTTFVKAVRRAANVV